MSLTIIILNYCKTIFCSWTDLNFWFSKIIHYYWGFTASLEKSQAKVAILELLVYRQRRHFLLSNRLKLLVHQNTAFLFGFHRVIRDITSYGYHFRIFRLWQGRHWGESPYFKNNFLQFPPKSCFHSRLHISFIH